MKQEHLRSMITAPRDGSIIILVYEDFSGLDFARWGSYENWAVGPDHPKEGWFRSEGDEAGGDAWLPCPDELVPLIEARWGSWRKQSDE